MIGPGGAASSFPRCSKPLCGPQAFCVRGITAAPISNGVYSPGSCVRQLVYRLKRVMYPACLQKEFRTTFVTSDMKIPVTTDLAREHTMPAAVNHHRNESRSKWRPLNLQQSLRRSRLPSSENKGGNFAHLESRVILTALLSFFHSHSAAPVPAKIAITAPQVIESHCRCDVFHDGKKQNQILLKKGLTRQEHSQAKSVWRA